METITEAQITKYLESVRKEATPGDNPRTNRVKMVRGWQTAIMEITENASGWEVSVQVFDSTSQGMNVGGSDLRCFPKERDARELANTWFTGMMRQGWRRTE